MSGAEAARRLWAKPTPLLNAVFHLCTTEISLTNPIAKDARDAHQLRAAVAAPELSAQTLIALRGRDQPLEFTPAHGFSATPSACEGRMTSLQLVVAGL